MKSSIKKMRGFTIVELLIVIIIIGILAGIVVITFSGTQAKGRDAERKTDLNGINAKLEEHFAEKGFYPTLAQINTPAYRTSDMPGLNEQALRDPKGASATLANAVGANQYAYEVTPAGCDNSAGNECSNYTLTATLEGGGTFVKQSSN